MKFNESLRNNTLKYPQLIVFKEKHADQYYLVESKEAEYRLFLQVLTERNKLDWYSWMEDVRPYFVGPIPKYNREDIDKIPESLESEKKKLLSELIRWEKAEKESEEIKKDYKLIQEAIKNSDTELAYKLLNKYSQDEYSGWSRESYTHIK